MKHTFLGFFIIMAGIFGVVFLVIFQNITINNESEYYVLKEAMEAAMLESVDLTCYRNDTLEGCGEVVKIVEQKFVENFTRRFLASVNGDTSQYQIEFYDIIESPPKASVVIRSKTAEYGIAAGEGEDGTFDIVNTLDGILVYEGSSEEEEEISDVDILSVENPENNKEEAIIEAKEGEWEKIGKER